MREILAARAGKRVDASGNVIGDLPRDHRDPSHLLTGILRCGKPKDGGGACDSRLRVKTYTDGKVFRYVCQSPSAGGCSGVGRRGDLVDHFISELVLHKMEEVQFAQSEGVEWSYEQEYREATERLEEFTDKWIAAEFSNDHYYRVLPKLQKKSVA
ncbi:zinc ribbon domain-containing protein [Acrocarpospora sp. B8E8]|uniref:zinc ribbon domain-containing protein n=1 Tax=Acrocarpospora sp. B8E8 TaxID=3153572 RepID=UPI00325E80CC